MDTAHLEETDDSALPLTQPAPVVAEVPQPATRATGNVREWTLETPMAFWEGLWGEDLVLAPGVEPDGPRLCDVEVGLANTTLSLADNGTGMHAQAEDDVSSQGSSDHMALAITTTQPLGGVPTTHATDNNPTTPDSADELLAAFESFLGKK